MLGIKFRKFGNTVPISGYKEDSLSIGSCVVVETSRGVEYGTIVKMICEKHLHIGAEIKLKKVLRYANPEDMQKAVELEEKEKAAAAEARRKISELGLPVRLLETELLFDDTKVIYYYKVLDAKKTFSSKQLIKDLSSQMNRKIELHSLGPREQARLKSGMGPCGRKICCASFLEEFPHVSVKMLKEQGIAINQSKICGLCGKFLCCLKYETDVAKKNKGETHNV